MFGGFLMVVVLFAGKMLNVFLIKCTKSKLYDGECVLTAQSINSKFSLFFSVHF